MGFFILMKLNIKFISFPSGFISYLIFIILVSCNNNKNTSELLSFTDSYTPEYAGGFRIKDKNGKESVIIESYNPWQGAKNDSRKLFIQRNGEEIPEGFDGVVLKGDAKRVVCMSSGHIAMIERLGKGETVVGGSSLDYVSSPEIRLRKGALAEIGYEGAYDYEALIASHPDLVVIYGVDGVSPIESKLKELGIPYLYVGDYLEESPLGKAEWMVAIGECLGVREDAIREFNTIKVKYEDVKGLLESIEENSDKPKVMLNAPYGGSWVMPPKGSYMVKLIQDAGGVYLFDKNGNSSTAISDEESLMMLGKADVWLNPGREYKNLDELKHKVKNIENVKCVKEGLIFDNTKKCMENGGNDFFESGIVNPDLILRDLIKIFHPSLVKEDFVYYRQLD